MSAKPRFTANSVYQYLCNSFLLSREALIGATNPDPTGTDIDTECRYPSDANLSIETYRYLYRRVGLARRVVNVFPQESWSVRPDIYETEEEDYTDFEKAWISLTKKRQVYHYLRRADELSGIGRFGILLFGIPDKKDLRDPVDGLDEEGNAKDAKERNLLFLRPFDEGAVTVEEIDGRSASPRFGLPTMYSIQLDEDDDESEPTLVHWHRVQHLADNCSSSDTFGTPRLEPVANYVWDARKVMGGASEMFWQGAFPGFSFETFPELTGEAEIDKESIKEELEAYRLGLQRFLSAVGGSWKSLAPQVADPTNHMAQIIQLIAATTGIPKRILVGTESGHLASTQDVQTWNRRLGERQTDYLEPRVVRPFVDKCIALGFLPKPKEEDYIVGWRDLNSLTDIEKADRALKLTQAILQYVAGGAETLMPPYEYLTLILDLTPEQATAIVDAAWANTEPLTIDLTVEDPATGSAGTLSDSSESTGQSGNTNAMQSA